MEERLNGQAGYGGDELLTAGELAKALKITRGSVYRLSESGRLPTILIGGKLRFRMNEVIAYGKSKAESRTEVGKING